MIDVEYAFQDLKNLPEGYEVPEGRVKPWGTAHAVLSCIDVIDGSFAVINTDDYYGRDSFIKIYDFLSKTEDDDKYRYSCCGDIGLSGCFFHALRTMQRRSNIGG